MGNQEKIWGMPQVLVLREDTIHVCLQVGDIPMGCSRWQKWEVTKKLEAVRLLSGKSI
jgi:hypothetical protein